MVRLSLLAALFLSFTVAGEFDHVVLLLLLLLGQHLLLGPQHQLRDAVEHLQEETRTGSEFNDTQQEAERQQEETVFIMVGPGCSGLLANHGAGNAP